MRGIFGFKCRTCLLPSAPQNLQQVGTGTNNSLFNATLSWDAPQNVGGGAILGYRVEMLSSSAPYVWSTIATPGTTPRTSALSWCNESGTVRVLAKNRCGWGTPSSSFNTWAFSSSDTVLYTASGTISIPCYAKSFKVWCVGRGGTSSSGGRGGGLTWKTWSVNSNSSNPTLTIQNQNLSSSGGSHPYASVTYGGQTITANGGDNDGQWSGGDGGRNGGTGGNSVGQQDWTSIVGVSLYSGWSMGGSVAGQGDYFEERAVASCQRIPINTTYDGGALSAAGACGLKTTEDCGVTGAFGSGGVKVVVNQYGVTNYYFSPGYGGGGFDANCPGGDGCVLVKFYS